MMPARVSPGRARYIASNRLTCACGLAMLVLGGILTMLVLSGSSGSPGASVYMTASVFVQDSESSEFGVKASRQFDRRRTASQQDLALETEIPEGAWGVVGRDDKPPDPPLPTDMERPVCSTRDRQAMAGAPPCRDPDSTVPHTDGNAKVALLFLVKNQIPTEPIWAAFMASAAELTLRKGIPPTAPKPIELLPEDEPTEEELGTKCWAHGGLFAPFGVPPREKFEGIVPPVIANVTGWLQENCLANMTPRQHYELQDLFSVYVHRGPAFKGADEKSLFYNRDIEDRIRAEFAQPSLVTAYRLLLQEALKDPRNTMFVLVSETCIPLHHPALFYTQLMAESHVSRVGSGHYNPQRWFHLMATPHLKASHFQKGDQWLTLSRMHAELAATDTHVWSQFRRFCRTQMACWQKSRYYGHVCVSDEHYVPTLLAAYGLSEQRDGIGVTTFTDWMSSQGSWHPKTFHPGSALDDIYSMRRRSAHSGCPQLPHKSLRSAASLFLHTPICHSRGDKVMMLQGPNYKDPPDVPQGSRHGRGLSSWSDALVATHSRRLQSTASDASEAGSVGDSAGGAGARRLSSTNLAEIEARRILGGGGVRDSVATGGQRRKLAAIPEFGPEHDRAHWEMAQQVKAEMTSNLAESGWLGGYEPMDMHCPLLGRRVEWNAVSEFAALAWRCDGLGFAWECLHAD